MGFLQRRRHGLPSGFSGQWSGGAPAVEQPLCPPTVGLVEVVNYGRVDTSRTAPRSERRFRHDFLWAHPALIIVDSASSFHTVRIAMAVTPPCQSPSRVAAGIGAADTPAPAAGAVTRAGDRRRGAPAQRREAALQDCGCRPRARAGARGGARQPAPRSLAWCARRPSINGWWSRWRTAGRRRRPAEAERTIASFVQAHAALRAAALRDNQRRAAGAGGPPRRRVVVLPTTSDPPAPSRPRLLVAQFRWPSAFASAALLEVWIDRRGAGGRGAGPRRPPGPAVGGEEPPPQPGRRLVAAASVRDPLWSPPIAGRWCATSARAHPRVGRRARRPLPAHGVAQPRGDGVTLVLGFVAFKQVQRSSALAARTVIGALARARAPDPPRRAAGGASAGSPPAWRTR